MCYYITIAARTGKLDALTSAFGRGYAIFRHANSTLARHLPNNFESFALTSGMCSCDLYVPKPERPNANTDQLRVRYEKLGWSETKIARAVRDSTNKPKGRPPEFVGLKPEVADKLVTTAASIGSMALIVHWYNRDDDEPVEPVRTRRYSLDDFQAASRTIGKDEIVWINSRPRS